MVNNFLMLVDIKDFSNLSDVATLNYNPAFAWPYTFLHPGCFCLANYFIEICPPLAIFITCLYYTPE